MHSLGIVQRNSTRRDHPGNPGGVSGLGPVIWHFSAKTRKKGVGEGFVRGRSDA